MITAVANTILHYISENRERNFEMIFLTGIGRKKHKNIVQMIFAFANKVGKECKVSEYKDSSSP